MVVRGRVPAASRTSTFDDSNQLPKELSSHAISTLLKIIRLCKNSLFKVQSRSTSFQNSVKVTNKMTNYTASDQIRFILQWFRTWSEIQKEDFVEILARKMTPGQVNGIANGMKSMDTSGRPPSLFSCQVKLFNDWFETWSDEDKNDLNAKLKDSDPKFWCEVEEELGGTRKKMDEDFFTVSAFSDSVPIQGVTTTVKVGGENGHSETPEADKLNNVTTIEQVDSSIPENGNDAFPTNNISVQENGSTMIEITE